MFRKLIMVLAAALIAAVFVLPAAAQFGWGFGTPFGCSPFGFNSFGFSPFAVSPFGTCFSSGFTTTSTFTSAFSTVNGVAVPFGCGFGSPFGLGFGGFSPFGFC